MKARRPSADDHREFLETYQEHIVNELNPMKVQLAELLQPWVKPAYWVTFGADRSVTPCPVREVTVRIERPEAVVDEILADPVRFPAGLSRESLTAMTDAMQGRVVAYLPSDVELVTSAICAQRILEFRDTSGLSSAAVGESRPEGGCSARYLARFRGADQGQWFELEVVTLLQQAAAELAHQLGWMSRSTYGNLEERYSEIASELRDLGRLYGDFATELAVVQDSADAAPQAKLTVENLPAALARCGLTCAQNQLAEVLTIMTSRGVHRVSDLLGRFSDRNLELIGQAYLTAAGWQPSALEIITTGVLLDGTATATPEEIEALTRANIEYLAAWDALSVGRLDLPVLAASP